MHIYAYTEKASEGEIEGKWEWVGERNRVSERETECQREGMRVSERENEGVRDRERQRER